MQTQKFNTNAMQKAKLRLLILVPLALLLGSCNEDVVFEKSQDLDSDGWHMNDVVTFQKEISDTTQLFDIFLNVRNNHEYPYSNFYVFFHTTFPSGTVYKDTIEMILADRQGNWTGEGFGKIKSNSFHFRKDVWFPEQGEFTFTIQHAMRDEYIEGISDIGMRIEKK